MALRRLNPIRSMTLTYINKSLCQNFIIRQDHTLKLENKKKDESEEDEMDAPIQYSTSEAAKWAARHSQAGVNDDHVPWYQGHLVAFSLACFLLYFGYFREMNDIDEAFEKELGDHFPDLNEEEFRQKFAAPPMRQNDTN